MDRKLLRQHNQSFFKAATTKIKSRKILQIPKNAKLYFRPKLSEILIDSRSNTESILNPGIGIGRVAMTRSVPMLPIMPMLVPRAMQKPSAQNVEYRTHQSFQFKADKDSLQFFQDPGKLKAHYSAWEETALNWTKQANPKC